MIKHLIKLVWNRKRANFLIMIEIFFSFLVLFAVAALAVTYADNYRRPLGFVYENVWNIDVDMEQAPGPSPSAEQVETARQLLLALREFDEIEAAASAQDHPFTEGGGFGILGITNNGSNIEYRRNVVTDDFDKVMGVTVTRGRWFGKEDDGASWQPVVINQQLAQAAFGDKDPIDRDLPLFNNQTRARVIGVITDFRHGGELSSPENLVFHRMNLNDPKEPLPRNLLIKLRPGTTRAFDEKLVRRLQDVAKKWSFDIRPMVELRETEFQLKLVPMIVVGLVAAFLMIMVALGLSGVLWQNVTRRTKEIGVRRAEGATAWNIHQQILGETLIITWFSLIAGAAIIAQFPLFDVIGGVSGQVYALSFVISSAAIYLLTIICSLYPSWLATKVQPAAALCYE
jgi:putative ABC transport system permease protein